MFRYPIAFKPQIDNALSNFLLANHLVTAWAIKKLNGNAGAINWLNMEIQKYPDDKVIVWCKDVYENKTFMQDDAGDANSRILQELM